MDSKMTINDIEEKLFNYVEFTLFLNGGKAFSLQHDLGTVLEGSDGIYLVGSYFLDDIAKNAELQGFLYFFKYTQILRIDLGDDDLGYIYMLHEFKDDIG